jgi:UDP-glucose 4-epimerase
MRNVLVTGVDEPLGAAILARVAYRPELRLLVGAGPPGTAVPAGVEHVSLPSEHGAIAAVLQRCRIDTIIHARHLFSGPTPAADPGAHVIAAMRLATAASDRNGPVRRFVLTSAAAVYPASARAPRLRREDEPLAPPAGTVAAALAEAEGYARDLAVDHPHLAVAILRLADLVGPGTTDPLAMLLGGWPVPALWGFDPAVQLLHVDDAADAAVHAATTDLAGVFNVAGTGVVRWRRAARLLRRPVLELPVAAARAMPFPVPGADTGVALRFGRALDTSALEATGFVPARSSEACVEAVRRGRFAPLAPLASRAVSALGA